MSDKYPDFETLSQHEISGVDYRILVRRATTGFSIVAIHGGGIEPGTSELADAVAGLEFSFYAFEGLKGSGNADLHITSTQNGRADVSWPVGRNWHGSYDSRRKHRCRW